MMAIDTEAVKAAAFDLFKEYVFEDMFVELLTPEAMALMRDVIEGSTRDEILDAARRVMGPKVEAVFFETMDGLGEIVAEALEAQKGVDGLARDLQEYVGLRDDQRKALSKLEAELLDRGVKPEDVAKQIARERDRMIRERAELIAHDQMNTAASAGEYEVMTARGMQFMRWIHRSDSKVSNGCLSNGFAGWIPVDKRFPSGHVHPGRHPRCRCTLAYKVILGNDERDHNAEQDRLRQEFEAAMAAGDKDFHPFADVEHSTA